MRTLLKMTHLAIVLLLGMGGVLSLLIFVLGQFQWAYLSVDLDFTIGPRMSLIFLVNDEVPLTVNINSPAFGWDASFGVADIDFHVLQFPDGTALTTMFLPWWLLLTIFSIYPAIYLIRRKRTATEGKCAKCGYDLRGSKHRCPECGLQFDNPPKRESQDVPI